MTLDLPELCYSISEKTKEVVIIKRGKMGYEPVSLPWKDMTLTEAEAYANNRNSMLGILPEERMAMEIGSILGWDLLGSDPQTYLDQAVLLSKKEIKAHIKDGILSILYPVTGDLYEYHLLGEKRCFFSWENLPKELSDRKPVTINGKDLLPVEVQCSKNGSITLFPVGRVKTREKKSKQKRGGRSDEQKRTCNGR